MFDIFPYMEFFVSVSFLIRIFLSTSFFWLFYGATQTDPDGLGSCASRSDSQISLIYSMAVFSTKSFRLFGFRLEDILELNKVLSIAVFSKYRLPWMDGFLFGRKCAQNKYKNFKAFSKSWDDNATIWTKFPVFDLG